MPKKNVMYELEPNNLNNETPEYEIKMTYDTLDEGLLHKTDDGSVFVGKYKELHDKKKKKPRLKYCMNRIKQNTAVSEIIGTCLMLIMVISTFGVIYNNVLSAPPPSNPPNVTIIGMVEGNNLVLEHQKGDPLSLDTAITLNMGIKNETFLVKKYLDAESIKDGEWNIGEKVIYPLSFNKDNIQSYFASYLHVADIECNSLVFIATLDVYPTTDIGITATADNLFPTFGSKVNFTIIVTNYNGGTPAKNIEILNLLSNTLVYFNSVTSRGLYNPNTGIWNIPYLEIGESASLTLTAIVTLTSGTQLAMILDGSTSINASNWNLMRTGLANAIKDPTVFPHDGTVELTVIQFGQKPAGGTTQIARTELGPIIVNKSNYISIGNTIQKITQLTGYTPMGCGIYLAADTLLKSKFLHSSDRQVICLVTDGQPNCKRYPNTTYTYTGLYVNDNYKTGRAVAEQARNYLINTLHLTPAQDQFDVIAVGKDTNTPWLKNKIAWPQPGNYAPPYDPGWVRNASSWQQFSASIYEMFRSLFNLSINYNVKIIAVTPSTDPDLGNNEVSIILIPD